MDGYRNAKADVKRIKRREEKNRLIFRIERDQAGRHGKRNGGVRRGPAPEDAPFDEAEMEAMAGINQ